MFHRSRGQYLTSTECTTYQRRQSIMSISQAVLNGEKYQVQKRTVILGISPGNPHYYKIETLERLFDLAGRTSEKVSSFYISDPSERITFGACLVNTDGLTKRLSKNHPFFCRSFSLFRTKYPNTTIVL